MSGSEGLSPGAAFGTASEGRERGEHTARLGWVKRRASSAMWRAARPNEQEKGSWGQQLPIVPSVFDQPKKQ